ncbi:hypothetical protein JCM8097_000837 [Rhodosporidiobolus ruineniae]
MTLTLSMVVSSLLGYVSLGCSVAAFIPIILTNAIKRQSGTGPWFLAAWLLGDVLNVIGIAKLGAQFTQVALAVWHFIADFLLLAELLSFGHSQSPAPAPKPSSNFAAQVKRRSLPPTRFGKFRMWLFKTFVSFGIWDDFKVLFVCILAGVSWWGLYIVISQMQNPDFEIEAKTDTTAVAFWIGMGASITYIVARIPEFWTMWTKYRQGEKPDAPDPIFFFLALDNVFNLASIFVLSHQGSLTTGYIHAELPWIFGSLGAIFGDLLIIGFNFFIWQPHYKKTAHGGDDEAKEKHRKEVLHNLDEHRLDLLEEWAAEDLANETFKPDEEVPEGKSFKDKRKAKKAKSNNKKLHALQDDYRKNLPNFTDIHTRANQRKRGMHGGNPFDTSHPPALPHASAHDPSSSSDHSDFDNDASHPLTHATHDYLGPHRPVSPISTIRSTRSSFRTARSSGSGSTSGRRRAREGAQASDDEQ